MSKIKLLNWKVILLLLVLYLYRRELLKYLKKMASKHTE